MKYHLLVLKKNHLIESYHSYVSCQQKKETETNETGCLHTSPVQLGLSISYDTLFIPYLWHIQPFLMVSSHIKIFTKTQLCLLIQY